MASNKGRYLAYLLRIWQGNEAGKSAWRASLEDPHTGERYGFANLETLIAFLWEQAQDRQNKTKAHRGNEGSE